MSAASPDYRHKPSHPPSSMHRADSTRSTTSSRSHRPASDSKQQEDLINALEAEEERLVNTLTRKLEKLRAEKAELENVLEAESESLVLRLQRQLSLLMQQQQQSVQPSSQPGPPNPATAPTSPSPSGAVAPNLNALITNPHPLDPSPSTLIEVLKTENSNLRNRLVDTEREYIKTVRQNEMYRSELIGLRQRANMPIDDLIGAAPSMEDSYPSAMSARRRSRGGSTSANGIPIPGLSGTGGEVRRRPHHAPSFSSSSIQLGSSSFSPSTPMTPSSLTGESNNMISASHGTSLTTPSTSYPGLPVPHSTPAASPANGRQHDLDGRPREQSTVAPEHSMPSPTSSGQDQPGFRLGSLSNTSPAESGANRCNGHCTGSTGTMRVAETGVLRPGSRSTSSSRSPIATSSGGAPGGPESRQQLNLLKE